MAVVLEDAMLVLLGHRTHSAYGLWRDHTRIFAETWSVDLRRITDAVGRLERHGLAWIGPMPAIRATSGTRRACGATPAGRRRQLEWLRAVPTDIGIEDMRIRGLLAVGSTDPRILDAFIASGLTHVRKRMRALSRAVPEETGLEEHAAVAFDREMTAAVARWLESLARRRPAAAAPARRSANVRR